MQSTLSEVKLRHLASNLGKEWTALATYLGVRSDEVDRIKDDYLGSEEQIFHMLMIWWQRWDHRNEGGETGAVDALCESLVKSGRTDVAQSLRGPETNVDDFNFEVCRDEFIRYYKDAMGVVPLLPWLASEVSKINDMYVKLKYNEKDNKAGRVVKRHIGSYEDMLRLEFHDGQPVRFILLSGIAGSGKTTIVSKIATDWALQTPGSQLSKFSFLVALSMRELKRAPDLTEAVFDQILAKDTKVNPVALKDHLRSHAEEVLVVLDGADEFDKEGSQLPTEGDIIDIISNKVLRGCTVIVTTRPHMVDKLYKLNPCFTRIETSGFSDGGVQEYIQKFFKGEDPEVSAMLCRYLMNSKSLTNLARTPIMLLLICLIWSGEHVLPDTLTELFKEAVYFMLRRYLQKFGQLYQDDDELHSQELHELVQDLGKVALDGLMLPGLKLVFEASEFGDSKKVVRACKIGVLLQERVRSKLRVMQHVTFFHKTFQEAIAGFYWASLAESDPDAFNWYLNQVNKKNALALGYLLRFCCGSDVNAARPLLTHLVGCGNMEDLGSLCLRMHLEAQCNELHNIMTPVFKNGLYFDLNWGGDIRLAFEFLIKCACQPSASQSSLMSELKDVTILRVQKNIPLVVDILRHAQNVTDITLDFSQTIDGTVVDAGLQTALGDALCQLPSLRNMSLIGKANLSATFNHMALLPPVSYIQRFVLRGIVVDSRHLRRFIERQDKLCHISLSNENLIVRDSCHDVEDSSEGDDENDDIASGEQQMKLLKQLSVKYYKTRFLVSCFRWSCPNLEVLELFGVDLQEEDFHRVGVIISQAPQLKVVDLSENQIGVAFPRLAEQFISLLNLEVLILKDVGLLPDDVGYFARVILPHLVSLRILSISKNDSLNAPALLSVMQRSCESSSLKELSIHSCVTKESEADLLHTTAGDLEDPPVDPTDTTHEGSVEILTLRSNSLGKCTSKITRLIKQLPSLKSLDMMHMPLSDSEMVCLADALRCCQQLRELYLYRAETFGDVGMEALLKILPDLPHLEHLELPSYTYSDGTDFMQECLKHRFPYGSVCIFELPHIKKVKQTVQEYSAKTK
ncbi:uncharacterized protein LOC119729330 [Patiria miniata]|uniref:NACHT domain-containing protein n=1 Tax=Patiria miniata TaxID=46514 RepID=A0A914A221_PATMI|nr:uncharacterized protein LOC119729330 [Patiria miniata]